MQCGGRQKSGVKLKIEKLGGIKKLFLRIKYLIIQFNSEIRAAGGGTRWNRDNLVPFYSLAFTSRRQTKAAAIEL